MSIIFEKKNIEQLVDILGKPALVSKLVNVDGKWSSFLFTPLKAFPATDLTPSGITILFIYFVFWYFHFKIIYIFF